MKSVVILMLFLSVWMGYDTVRHHPSAPDVARAIQMLEDGATQTEVAVRCGQVRGDRGVWSET